jgi:cytoskeletal protein RodZ
MESFFQELRRAREQSNNSLQDISEQTLINIRFLEAIEQGNIAILPQAYVRAFIREYAAVIGLDPLETMKRYDRASALPAEQSQETPPQPPPPSTPPPRGLPSEPEEGLMSSKAARTMTALLLFISAIVAIVAIRNTEQAVPTQEIPFQSVVKENEVRLGGSVAEKAVPQATPTPSAKDSLTLYAAVSDTVWMQVTVDTLSPHEYIFRPGAKMSWKARDRFVVTLGNAGAVHFTMNQKPLGTLGKPGAVVRSVELSRTTLGKQ